MAVARLTQARILAGIRALSPSAMAGIARRRLLDHLAGEVLSPRAKPGAKGRLARRLYRGLEALVRRGSVRLEGTLVFIAEGGQGGSSIIRPPSLLPELSAPVRRAWFFYLMALDRPVPSSEEVDAKAQALSRLALDEGWTTLEIARLMGSRS